MTDPERHDAPVEEQPASSISCADAVNLPDDLETGLLLSRESFGVSFTRSLPPASFACNLVDVGARLQQMGKLVDTSPFLDLIRSRQEKQPHKHQAMNWVLFRARDRMEGRGEEQCRPCPT